VGELDAGLQYKFRVAAENIQGQGNWSDFSSLTDAPGGWTYSAPNVPTGFGRHTDAPVAGLVKLTWTALVEADAGGSWDAVNDLPIGIGYEVYGGPDQFNMVAQPMVNPANTFHEQAVPSGSSWWFKVRSKNAGGLTSAFTTAQEFVSAQVPNAPASYSVWSTNVGVMTLTWSIPTWNGGSVITKYKIVSTVAARTIEVENYLLTATLFGLGPGVLCDFTLTAVNAVGESAPLYEQVRTLA